MVLVVTTLAVLGISAVSPNTVEAKGTVSVCADPGNGDGGGP